MPCYRCGARQTDPVRGASPWKRGVRADRLVLICPGCQAVHGWTDDLDRCAACGSTVLVRRLGEVECRQCGQVRMARTEADVAAADEGSETAAHEASGAAGLSDEVARALARVLGKGPDPRGTPPES
ncbi:MAG: hypothetical protein JWO67_5495 [Streptosporangiaceae bacterium]|jgi:hypothetical protein|nr:hypothetical protein [Streptosporangiaceae bacterium]